MGGLFKGVGGIHGRLSPDLAGQSGIRQTLRRGHAQGTAQTVAGRARECPRARLEAGVRIVGLDPGIRVRAGPDSSGVAGRKMAGARLGQQDRSSPTPRIAPGARPEPKLPPLLAASGHILKTVAAGTTLAPGRKFCRNYQLRESETRLGPPRARHLSHERSTRSESARVPVLSWMVGVDGAPIGESK